MSESGGSIRPLKQIGGDLALDFSNTADREAGRVVIERLNTYSDLIRWSWESGLLDQQQAADWQDYTVEQPEHAAANLIKAHQLRETIYHVCSTYAHHREVDEAAMRRLNIFIQEGRTYAHLRLVEGKFEWKWLTDGVDLGYPLWIIAEKAAVLLSTQADKLKECAGVSCGWLFLDTSRNHSRRWCDMTECGNREKARRHYRRAISSK